MALSTCMYAHLAGARSTTSTCVSQLNYVLSCEREFFVCLSVRLKIVSLHAHSCTKVIRFLNEFLLISVYRCIDFSPDT